MAADNPDEGYNSAEGTILPYANAWAPIHSYYAVYMASVALLAAQGHEGSLKSQSRSLGSVTADQSAKAASIAVVGERSRLPRYRGDGVERPASGRRPDCLG